MDDKAVVERLTVARLAKLAAAAGLAGTSRLRKRELVARVVAEMDAAMRHEMLLLFSGAELRAIAADLGITVRSTRKRELVQLLLTHDQAAESVWLADDDLLVADHLRRDLPSGNVGVVNMELMPGRPGGAEQTRFFEVQELLRRPNLSRAVIVATSCDDPILARMLGEGLDDLIESAARLRSETSDRPLVSIVLDGTRHGLVKSERGRTLVTLARELVGRVEIRLGPRERRLAAELLLFEELRAHGPFVTAMIGASAERSVEDVISIEASLWTSGALASLDSPASQVDEWVTHLIRESRRVRPDELARLEPLENVERKARYKKQFDTAHELRLKHLAEMLARRGRYASPLYDPTMLPTVPPHQLAALARAAEPGRVGGLLLDEPGLGKTVEAGLVLARELRRRRVYASDDSAACRRALVIAPTSRHEHWLEVLTGMFGLEVGFASWHGPANGSASWRGREAQVVLGGPEAARDHWEDLQGFEILVVANAHLYEEDTMTALEGIRDAAELCLVLSGVPAQHEVTDVIALARLAMPDHGWASYDGLIDDPPALEVAEHLGHELRADATRAIRDPFLEDGRLVARAVEDRHYDLEDREAAIYAELRRMRADYLRRGSETKASAFVALEQAFLSSWRAFHAAAGRLVGDLGPRDDADLLPRVAGDRSFAFVRSSSYYQRRIRAVRDMLAPQARADAPIAAKEAALLELLGSQNSAGVVVLSKYRATQQRLRTVLARAKLTPVIELLDDQSSLRERLSVVDRFGARLKSRGGGTGPAGVMLATDRGVRHLSLAQVASVVVNYDLPWNPQQVESRIRRIHRWGQGKRVRVVNLAACASEAEAWTMDHRVLFVCRELFEISEPEQPPSDALIEIEPDELEASMAAETSPEISLIAEPDEEVVELVDALLIGEAEHVAHGAVALAEEDDLAYRERLADFWSRVCYGHSDLRGARGYLYGRLGLALLQGMFGIVGTAEASPDDGFEVAVGVRLLVEAASHARGEEPVDDAWLIEDEAVHLWVVGGDGAVEDGTEELLEEGLIEIEPATATELLGEEVVTFLRDEKARVERAGVDAVALERWRARAPNPLGERLADALVEAEHIAVARREEIEATWRAAFEKRIERLERRQRLAVAAENADATPVTEALARARLADVSFRHEVLGTQLFILFGR
jgi:Helicase conserved C-terminal domain/SNF2-related domain